MRREDVEERITLPHPAGYPAQAPPVTYLFLGHPALGQTSGDTVFGMARSI